MHFTVQPEISEIDLERERRIENRRGGEVSAEGRGGEGQE